jgi:hypothetical protein
MKKVRIARERDDERDRKDREQRERDRVAKEKQEEADRIAREKKEEADRIAREKKEEADREERKYIMEMIAGKNFQTYKRTAWVRSPEKYNTPLTTVGGGQAHKTNGVAVPPCRKSEILDTHVRNIDNPQKWDAEVNRQHNIENKTRENDFSGKFPENGKLENTFNEYEMQTSTGQKEALIVPEDKETKFIVRAFPRKNREILVQYEKPNVGIQFPFDNELFVSAVRIKKTKRDKRNIKRTYNEAMQSKMVDTGVQIRFNDDLLFCANDKIEKSRDEKRSVKKRQNLEIQPAVAKNKKSWMGCALIT